MSIQGIGANTPVNTSTQQPDPRIKNLEQQISTLRKQLQEVRSDQKMNAKVKEEKTKEVEKKIQILEQKKTQIQTEERQKKQKTEETDKPDANQNAKNQKHVVDENVQNVFIQADSLNKTESALGVVREQIKGEIRIAESNSYLRTPDAEAAAKARGKLAIADGYMQNKVAEVTESLKEVSDEPDSLQERLDKEEADSEKKKGGTGRMEPGQFLDDEA